VSDYTILVNIYIIQNIKWCNDKEKFLIHNEYKKDKKDKKDKKSLFLVILGCLVVFSVWSFAEIV
jgi:hypothetical protein